MRKSIFTLFLAVPIFCFCHCSPDSPAGTTDQPEKTDPSQPGKSSTAAYVTTKDGARLFEEENLKVSKPASMSPNIVKLQPSEQYQTVDGFGCAITGSTCYNLLKMTKEDRTAFLKETFDPETGVGSSMVRVAIGSSDFGLDEYTWCDTPGMENFAPHTLDKRDVFPILKEIYEINPDVRIIGSPWSAPRWMKRAVSNDGDHYEWTSGRLKPECYQDYADYFVKWIQTMEAEGFKIYGITPQNEPLNHGNSMSMYMPWEEQRDFIKTALGPAFEKAGIDARILVFDHNYNYDNKPGQENYPLNIYKDAEAAKYIAGSAWHNYGGNVSTLDGIHAAVPDKDIFFTEASIGTWNYKFYECLMNDWRDIFMGTLSRYGKGVTLWNLMLDDKKGPNRPGGCTTCYGAVDISSADYKTITKRTHWYQVAHASVAVKPGAVRIGTSGYEVGGVKYLAFQNPDGSYGILGINETGADAEFVFTTDKSSVRYKFPANSIVSIKWKE